MAIKTEYAEVKTCAHCQGEMNSADQACPRCGKSSIFLSSISQEEFLDLLWRYATTTSLAQESQTVLQEEPVADVEQALTPAVDADGDAAPWMKTIETLWREFWE